MTNHGISLWKTVFKNNPTLPSCPSDLSEPHWAALLFGPGICEVNQLLNFTGHIKKNSISIVEALVLWWTSLIGDIFVLIVLTKSE